MTPLPPLTIGPLVLDSPFLLAPMAGHTDFAFRRICRRFGAGLVFTEVASAEGLRRRSPQTLHFLASGPEEQPIAAHLYGAEPAAFAAAAAVIEPWGRFALIDINCGCPVPKITRRGGGAALIETPERIEAIVAAVRAAVRLPVTVKTRLGTIRARPRIREVLRAVENGGGAALIIHGRFTKDRHQGEADWEAIAEVKAQAAIPVIGNGGIVDAGEAAAKLKRYGVDGVMIGRGAIGNPWIFSAAIGLGAGRPFTPPTPRERLEVMADHLANLHRSKLEEARLRGRTESAAGATTCREFFGHLSGYLAGTPGLADLRKGIIRIESPAALLAAAAFLLTRERRSPDSRGTFPGEVRGSASG